MTRIGAFPYKVSLKSSVTPYLVSQDTAAGPYADVFLQIAGLVSTILTARRAVECRAFGPLAGLSSVQILQVSTHLAAIRAGTIHDGQFQHRESIQRYLPSGMVDPHSERAAPTSTAEPVGQRILRNIRRPRHTRDTSTAQAHSHNQQLSHTQIHQPATHRNARAGTAAGPYAEIFSSKGRSFVTSLTTRCAVEC